MKKFDSWGLLIAALLVSSGTAVAGNGGGDNSESENPVEDTFQLDQIYTSKSSVTRQSMMVVGDGTRSATLVYDAPSDRVYFSNPQGAADAPLMEVALVYAAGNAQVANDFANSVRQFANSPGAFERSIGPSYTFGPPGGGSGACDLSPCGPGRFTPDLQTGDFSRQMGIRSFDFYDGWWEATHDPEEVEQDKRYFEIWRNGECEKAAEEDWDIGEGAAATAIACPFVETGLGAAACGLAVSQLLRSLRHDTTHKTCTEGYPGPGRWAK